MKCLSKATSSHITQQGPFHYYLIVHMEWAHKLWLANAVLVASTLRVVFGLPAVIFTKQCLTWTCSRSVVCRDRISNFAHESAVRGLFTMTVLMLSSSIGFGTYWHWCDAASLTNGIIASGDCRSQNCAKSKRAFKMEVIVAFALPLLVAVSIYLWRWNNKTTIGSLNRTFKFIYDNHQKSNLSQRQSCFWDEYGRLAVKQAFEVMALGVLWLNLKPLNHSNQGHYGEHYRVGKLISSIGSMIPAVVCLLVSIEMGINFSFIASTLTTLNWSLDSFIKFSHTDSILKKVKHAHSPKLLQNSLVKNVRCLDNMNSRNYLRKLIAEYDELGHGVQNMVELYSPNLLLIIGMHFVLFTMQLFLCYREMSRSTSNLANFSETLFPMLSAIASAGQIVLLVEMTTNVNHKIEATAELLNCLSSVAEGYGRYKYHKNVYKELHNSVTVLSLVVNRFRDSINLYGYFDLDRSLITTIIASTCSYLIVLIQVM